jgi:hypothetical protein
VGYVVGTRFSGQRLLTLPDLASCLVGTDPAATAKCLDADVKQLLSRYSAAEIMDYVSASTTPTDILYICHPIGHIVGGAVYRKYGSIEAALAQCNSACRSACTHGVIGAGVTTEMGEIYPDDDVAHASEAQLRAIGQRYCEQSSQTCHAIGHVAYIATGEIEKALGLCDTVASGANLQPCYEGVFMERAGTFSSVLSPKDAMTKPPIHIGDYAFPCDEVADTYKHACYLFTPYYQQPLFAADGIMTPAAKHVKEVAFCGSLPAPDRAFCFEGMGTVSFLFGTNIKDLADMESFCDKLSILADRNSCTKGMLVQYIYFNLQNDGLAYCEGIDEESRRMLCYNTTFMIRERNYGFSNDTARMCGSNTTCAVRYTTYLHDATPSST